jgi:hypothetical protein
MGFWRENLPQPKSPHLPHPFFFKNNKKIIKNGFKPI